MAKFKKCAECELSECPTSRVAMGDGTVENVCWECLEDQGWENRSGLEFFTDLSDEGYTQGTSDADGGL